METSKEFWDKVRERVAYYKGLPRKQRTSGIRREYRSLLVLPEVQDIISDGPLVGLSVPTVMGTPKKKEKNLNKRKRLMEQQGGKCAYCSEPFNAQRIATYDHIKPKSKGGGNNIANLVLACQPCNSLKGNMASYAEAKQKAELYMAFADMLKEKGYIQ